eukprot:5875578-Amphidinium_carterae.1
MHVAIEAFTLDVIGRTYLLLRGTVCMFPRPSMQKHVAMPRAGVLTQGNYIMFDLVDVLTCLSPRGVLSTEQLPSQLFRNRFP